MCKKNKQGIKKGQVWRAKKKNYCIEVGHKIRDGFWCVYPHGKKVTVHSMREGSFHFYELISENF